MTRRSTSLSRWLLGSLLSLLAVGSAEALDSRVDPGGFRDDEREVAEELAGYTAQERHAALIAAQHPEDLLEIQRIQRGSADRFAALIEDLSRDEQERVWDLVRYPGLVAELARDGPKSTDQLAAIAERYPEEIRATIRSEGRKHHSTWVEVYALELESEQAFGQSVARHPQTVRAAFGALRSRPDLLTLLVENIGMTTRVGAAYRADPTRVEARFDALSQDVAARRARQQEQWSQELQDPEAREELRTAAQEFAEDQGYALDEAQDGVRTTRVVHVDHYVNVNPYPYWFGYPSWYAYPYWYPATVWNHLGFRYGNGGTFIGFGLPSPYFLGWYNDFYYGFGPAYYGGWGYPSRNYWGANPYRSFRSVRYFDDHRPRYFYGHRRRHDRHHYAGGGRGWNDGPRGGPGGGPGGGHHDGQGGYHDSDRDRRDAQDRLMRRPSRDGRWDRNTRDGFARGGRNPAGDGRDGAPDGIDRSERPNDSAGTVGTPREGGRRGAQDRMRRGGRIEPGNPQWMDSGSRRTAPGLGSPREGSPDSRRGGREQRWRSRGGPDDSGRGGAGGALPEGGERLRNRRGTRDFARPDVSAGPPAGPFARQERGRAPGFDRREGRGGRDAYSGGAPRERMMRSPAGREREMPAMSRGGSAPQGGGRRRGDDAGVSAGGGGGRFGGGGHPGAGLMRGGRGDAGGGGAHRMSQGGGPSGGGQRGGHGGGGQSGGHGGGHGGGRGGGHGGRGGGNR